MNLLDELHSRVNRVAVAIYALNNFSGRVLEKISRRRRIGYIGERQAGSTASLSRLLPRPHRSTIVISLQVCNVNVSAGIAQATQLERADLRANFGKARPILIAVRFSGSPSKVCDLLVNYLVIWHRSDFAPSAGRHDQPLGAIR